MSKENIVLTEAVYYILLALHTPLHGYGIMQKVEELSSGRVKLAAGTLYGALQSMTDKGWIAELPGKGGGRKREYEITGTGRDIAKNELERLRELFKNGDMIIGGAL